MPTRTAIVGAGLSGLAAALRLSEGGAEVRIFEKSRGLSGRAASRTRHGCRYDFGANYFTVGSNAVARMVFETLSTEGLGRVVGEILPFDRDGKVSPGDPERNAGARWTYRDGINTLGKRIVETGRLAVETGVRIARLERLDDGWRLESDEGRSWDDFDCVLLTAPVPQAADLLEASELRVEWTGEIVAALREADYHCQFSVVLNFSEEISLPGGAYALVNADREHELAWLSLENRKAGRVPDGRTLLVAQMSPDWSARHYEASAETVVALTRAAVAGLLARELPEPRWTDVQRWRYAHPRAAVASGALLEAAECGLCFAGDGLVGRGRVGEAIETGFAAAESILARAS